VDRRDNTLLNNRAALFRRAEWDDNRAVRNENNYDNNCVMTLEQRRKNGRVQIPPGNN
jgi:hypothetical protein